MGTCLSTTLREKYGDVMAKTIESPKVPDSIRDAAFRSLARTDKQTHIDRKKDFELELSIAQRELKKLEAKRESLLETERNWIREQRRNRPNQWTDDLAERAQKEWKRGFLKNIKTNAKLMAEQEFKITAAESGIENSQDHIDNCERFSKVGAYNQKDHAEFLASYMNKNYEMQNFSTATNALGTESTKFVQSMKYGAPGESSSSSSSIGSADDKLIASLMKQLISSTSGNGESSKHGSGISDRDDDEDEILFAAPAAVINDTY